MQTQNIIGGVNIAWNGNPYQTFSALKGIGLKALSKIISNLVNINGKFKDFTLRIFVRM